MKLHNSKIIYCSCSISDDEPIISMFRRSFLYFDKKSLNTKCKKVNSFFFPENYPLVYSVLVVGTIILTVTCEFQFCVDLRTKPSLPSLYIEQYPESPR